MVIYLMFGLTRAPQTPTSPFGDVARHSADQNILLSDDLSLAGHITKLDNPIKAMISDLRERIAQDEQISGEIAKFRGDPESISSRDVDFSTAFPAVERLMKEIADDAGFDIGNMKINAGRIREDQQWHIDGQTDDPQASHDLTLSVSLRETGTDLVLGDNACFPANALTWGMLDSADFQTLQDKGLATSEPVPEGHAVFMNTVKKGAENAAFHEGLTRGENGVTVIAALRQKTL